MISVALKAGVKMLKSKDSALASKG